MSWAPVPCVEGFAFARLPPGGRGPSSARATRFRSFAALRTWKMHRACICSACSARCDMVIANAV